MFFKDFLAFKNALLNVAGNNFYGYRIPSSDWVAKDSHVGHALGMGMD